MSKVRWFQWHDPPLSSYVNTEWGINELPPHRHISLGEEDAGSRFHVTFIDAKDSEQLLPRFRNETLEYSKSYNIQTITINSPHLTNLPLVDTIIRKNGTATLLTLYIPN